VFDKPQEFLSRYTADETDGSASAFGLSFVLAADLRASLNILAFIARSDGHFADSEATAVADFCTVFAKRFATPKFLREGATSYARKLAPDSETFILALTRLKRPDAPAGLAKLIVQASSNLIQADGEFSEHELHFGEQVFEFLDAGHV
jgi:tellurite resistance protein